MEPADEGVQPRVSAVIDSGPEPKNRVSVRVGREAGLPVTQGITYLRTPSRCVRTSIVPRAATPAAAHNPDPTGSGTGRGTEMMPRASARAGSLTYRPCDGRANPAANRLSASGTAPPVFGRPWPAATVRGRRAASARTLSRAASQSVVSGMGGHRSSRRIVAVVIQDSWFIVASASPANRTPSASFQKETWPAVWPGVGMARQPGSGGTVPSSGSTCNAPAQIRAPPREGP